MRRSRAVSAGLVLALVFTMCFGMTLPAYAATELKISRAEVINVTDPDGNALSNVIRNGTECTITIAVYFPDPGSGFKEGKFTGSDFSTNISYWKKGNGSSLEMELGSVNPDDGLRTALLTLSNVVYQRSDKSDTLNITGSLEFKGSGQPDELTFSKIETTVPQSYFTNEPTNPSSPEEDDELPTPDILIESVRAFDKNGKILDEVTEDTEEFTLEIYFTDYGMAEYEDDIDSDYLEVYATNTGGFKIETTRGRLYKLGTNSKSDSPRFAARFSDVTYDGSANTFSFRVHYDIWSNLVTGTSTATVSQATAEEEEENEIPPATPHIIVSQYSYGEEQIDAGNEFMLNITYKNTSADVALENIVMTITPKSEHTTIAAASNTIYIDNLLANGAMDYPIALKTLPAASGSQNVDISFKYEYIVEVNSKTKERKTGEDVVSISIPVVQIDRFSVDPITEMTEYVAAGDQFFVTVGFVNEGKSPIYNISARARGVNKEVISGTSRVEGTLAASANDELEIDVICQEPGDLVGEVVITYEDENTNQKEIVMPFNIFLEEPYVPEQPMDPGMMDPGMMSEEPKTDRLTLILSIIGGLFMAVPIALYVSKRVKAKDSEEFDEDF